MKKIAFIIGIAALVAACENSQPAQPNPNPPTPPAESQDSDSGGPCGDGRVLRENEVCP
jgi:hypothetical protein